MAARKLREKYESDALKSKDLWHKAAAKREELTAGLAQAKMYESMDSKKDKLDRDTTKIEKNLKKAQADEEKYERDFKSKVVAHNKHLPEYKQKIQSTMSMCANIEKRRVEFMKGAMLRCMNAGTRYSKDFYAKMKKNEDIAKAADGEKDMSAFAVSIGVFDEPPIGRVTKRVENKELKSAALAATKQSGSIPTAWFVKQPQEGKGGRARNRYMALEEQRISYYTACKNGLPKNKKGDILLRDITAIRYRGKNLIIETGTFGNVRYWSLTAKRDIITERWAHILSQRCRIALGAWDDDAIRRYSVAVDPLLIPEGDAIADAENEAATKIQSAWRGHRARKYVERRRRASDYGTSQARRQSGAPQQRRASQNRNPPRSTRSPPGAQQSPRGPQRPPPGAQRSTPPQGVQRPAPPARRGAPPREKQNNPFADSMA